MAYLNDHRRPHRSEYQERYQERYDQSRRHDSQRVPDDPYIKNPTAWRDHSSGHGPRRRDPLQTAEHHDLPRPGRSEHRQKGAFGTHHRVEDIPPPRAYCEERSRQNESTELGYDGRYHGKQSASNLIMQPLANISTSAPQPYQSDFKPGPAKGRRVKDNFVNKVVDQCGGAVVRVETEQKVTMPDVDADIFSFFFGKRPEKGKQERKVHGNGSGFCIDGANGVVLTNAHVVQGADRVSISFGDGAAALECEILEIDEVIDLAAIKVKERLRSPLPSVPMGSSESLRTGDWAIVLGNPLGLQNTCTLGIISSLERSTGESGFDWMRHPLLQTDAAVNQGNSGGPLLNEVGEVVGMISMRALFGEGIGFAIPADTITSALPNLLRRKKVARGYLGLKMSNESPDEERNRGAYVQVVLPRSPAELAGFKVGDQIVEAEGRKVKHFSDVQRLVRGFKVGDQMQFKVKRGSRTSSLSLAVAVEDIKQLRKETPQASGRGAPNDGQPRLFIIPSRSK